MLFAMNRNTLSRENIAATFDKISASYDKTNSYLSFGLHHWWRRQCERHLPDQNDLTLVDLATGTGDQIIALSKSKKISSFIGFDIAKEMLHIGRVKIDQRGLSNRANLRFGNALKIPLDDLSCDVTTISFGIRNVSDPLLCLHEMHRILKKGGRAMILEFSLPKNRILRPFILLYLRKILPKIGGFLTKNPNAYHYLNETIEKFPSGDAFCSMMRNAGFKNISSKSMTLGTVTLYIGEK